MFEQSSRRNTSSSVVSSSQSALTFGTDLNRDPVYLSGQVIPSVAFAQAMLTLGAVVQIQRPSKKDNSEYQAWVMGEYLRILNERQPTFEKQYAELTARQLQLKAVIGTLNKKIDTLSQHLYTKRKQYFNWLYENDRDAWVVLDPIVSVQKDGTFFEAFSGDESIYARVFLPHTAIKSAETPSLGTTNIDFSRLLERELARVRSYRPMSLTVGLKSVDFKTTAAIVEEEKIPLPETWVRGLVEVQSVLALAPTTFEMSADALAEIIARLQSEKEKHGPRSLKFMLKPHHPIRVEIEPWGEIFADDWCKYEGEIETTVRIWGRRRLGVLKEILVGASRVKVHFLGSGMPSFWTVTKDDVELTIGLSGWTSNDWASKAKFSSFIPTSQVKEELLPKALESIIEMGSVTTSDFATSMGLSIGEASALLQKLCLQGKTMFDPERGVYRWRDLFPTLEIYKENDSSRESKQGLELYKSGNIKKTLDDIKEGIRYLAGTSKFNDKEAKPVLELDSDNRPKYAQCSCSFYNFNKLRQGPCRHMIALLLVGEKQ